MVTPAGLLMAAEPHADSSADCLSHCAALHLACWHARMASIRVLLDGGAALDVEDGAGRTAWQLAQAAGHTDVEAMLRQHEEVLQALQRQQQQQQQQEAQRQIAQHEEERQGGGTLGNAGTD